MRFKLLEKFEKSSDNIYELYRGTASLPHIEDSKKAIWLTPDIEKAEEFTLGHGSIFKYLVKIQRPYIIDSHDAHDISFNLFIDLYKPKYKSKYPDYYKPTVPFFSYDGEVSQQKKWKNYFMGFAEKNLPQFKYDISYKIDKNGNKDYEWDNQIYWFALDELNMIKLRELGYDAMIYSLDEGDEYCILYPNKQILEKVPIEKGE